jgi:hypothetical protein
MLNDNILPVLRSITYLERSNPTSNIQKGQTSRLASPNSNISHTTKQ